MKQFFYILSILILGSFTVPIHAVKQTYTPFPTINKLEELNLAILESANTSQEYDAIFQLKEEAVRQENSFFEGLSYYHFIRFHHHNLQTEDAKIWLQGLEKVAQNHKYNQLLFEGKKFIIELYCEHGDYNLALDEAEKVLTTASILKKPTDLMIARQCIATVYLQTECFREAVEILNTIPLSEIPEKDSFIRDNTLLLLIQAKLGMKEYTSAHQNIQELSQNLKQKKELHKTSNISPYDYKDVWFKYHYFSAYYYMLNHKIPACEEHLSRIRYAASQSPYTNYHIMLHKINGDFYALNQQYESAIKEWNAELNLLDKNFIHYQKVLDSKASLANRFNHYKEAYDIYLQLIHLKDSVEQTRYIHQINRFNVEYRAKQKTLKNEQLRLQSHSLYLLVISSFLFCLFLILMIFINHKMKKKLQKEKEKAERSGKLKSAFLANMNHEIRTPLNAIAGFSELLADETDQETSQQYANIIKDNNELLLRLLNDVLDISKIESNTITFTHTWVHLPELINDLYKIMKLQSPSYIEIQKDEIPDLFLYTDRSRLRQILSNLLSNAIKHTSKGSITFGYRLIDKDTIRFHVTDTGTGISQEQQNAIFIRFVQAVESQKKGVGLGLALCKGFVEHMDGKIGVISKEGEGSTFWFTLPYKAQE